MTDLLVSVRGILSNTVPRWESLLETTPEELLQRPPASGEWSAADCLGHLLVTERAVFGQRLRAILAGRELAVFDPGHPRDAEPEREPRDVLAALGAERRENLDVLKGLTGPDLERAGRHPQYGMVELRVVLNTWAAHDLQHTVQAEEALMQAFLPGTGPFRYRFAAHETSA
jgi:hypothetical protein